MTDISPIRAFVGLKHLACDHSGDGKGALSDLSPLAGMQLSHLRFLGMLVSDLSPLAGVPLIYLGCNRTQVPICRRWKIARA